MANFTERVRFTVPKALKDEWKQSAAARGVSLSALLRGMIGDFIAMEELAKTHRLIEAQRNISER